MMSSVLEYHQTSDKVISRMRHVTTEQLWNLDNASLKGIEYSLNSACNVAQLNFIMVKAQFTNDYEQTASYSETQSTKSKNCSTKPKLSIPTSKQAIFCKHNSVDSNTSVNMCSHEETSKSSCMSGNSDISYPPSLNTEKIKLKDNFYQASDNMNKLDGIIQQIENLTFLSNSSKKSNSFEKDDALNSNYCNQDHQMNIYIEKENDTVEKRSNNSTLDNRLEDQDNDDNLIARGPVRPHLNSNRNKPYDTLDWLFQSDTYSSQEYSDGQQSETSDYETSIRHLLTDNDFRDRIDSCLEQLSDSSQKSEIYNKNISSETKPREKYCSNQESMTISSSKAPPTIVVKNPEGSSLLDILARGGFQAAHVFSDGGTTNGSSSGMNSENWPDSPASSYNVVTSRPNSRASSRAQSPGCAMMPINISGSPMDSPQMSLNFRSHQGFSSSSSSNQSYCETPSPANYQSPLDQRSEDQLDEGFSRFISWEENYESSGTIVGNNTAELIDAIDSTELQLVEEVVLKELSSKSNILEEMQVVPDSQSAYRGFETQKSIQSLQNPTDKDSKCSSDSSQRDVSDKTNSSPCTDMNFFSESLNFGNTGSIINEAQQSLVYPKTCDGFDLVYSEKQSPVGCRREKSSPTNSYMGNTSPHNNYIGKTSPASLEIDATIENILANYSKANENQNPNNIMNGFDMDLFDCTKSTCTTYSNSSNINSKKSPTPEQATTSTFNDFQIPEILSRHSTRHTAPWSSLNIPSSKACDKLIKELKPKDVEKAMKTLLKKTNEELTEFDKDGDTVLMCLVGNSEELKKKKAYLVPLVERLSTIEGALSMENNRGEDALYLMAMNCPEMAFITGYLAAKMLQKEIEIGQKLYHFKGDTLIHAVAAKGDSHEAVLSELLALKTIQGHPAFNISTRNYAGKTALHVAVESHDPGKGISSIATAQLLLENGADPSIKDAVRGNTALHTAVVLSCDPALIKVLLGRNRRDTINIINYHGNTSLQMASMCKGINLERQMEVCKILVENGALCKDKCFESKEQNSIRICLSREKRHS